MAAGAAVAQSTSPVREGSSPTFKHRRGGEKREDAKSARLKPYPQTPLVAKARHVTTSRNEPRVGLEMVHK